MKKLLLLALSISLASCATDYSGVQKPAQPIKATKERSSLSKVGCWSDGYLEKDLQENDSFFFCASDPVRKTAEGKSEQVCFEARFVKGYEIYKKKQVGEATTAAGALLDKPVATSPRN